WGAQKAGGREFPASLWPGLNARERKAFAAGPPFCFRRTYPKARAAEVQVLKRATISPECLSVQGTVCLSLLDEAEKTARRVRHNSSRFCWAFRQLPGCAKYRILLQAEAYTCLHVELLSTVPTDYQQQQQQQKCLGQILATRAWRFRRSADPNNELQEYIEYSKINTWHAAVGRSSPAGKQRWKYERLVLGTCVRPENSIDEQFGMEEFGKGLFRQNPAMEHHIAATIQTVESRGGDASLYRNQLKILLKEKELQLERERQKYSGKADVKYDPTLHDI
uniref:Ricin B-type lectin domain-containing protein n=1 Tax=Macrostomum lignano TaxID=282301 RepID=A0A1I8FA74_9PLAT